MLSLTSPGPLVLKGLPDEAGAKDKRRRSVSIQEVPSPIMPADLDKKGGEKWLALMLTDIWKHRCGPEPCNKPKPDGGTPLTV